MQNMTKRFIGLGVAAASIWTVAHAQTLTWGQKVYAAHAGKKYTDLQNLLQVKTSLPVSTGNTYNDAQIGIGFYAPSKYPNTLYVYWGDSGGAHFAQINFAVGTISQIKTFEYALSHPIRPLTGTPTLYAQNWSRWSGIAITTASPRPRDNAETFYDALYANPRNYASLNQGLGTPTLPNQTGKYLDETNLGTVNFTPSGYPNVFVRAIITNSGTQIIRVTTDRGAARNVEAFSYRSGTPLNSASPSVAATAQSIASTLGVPFSNQAPRPLLDKEKIFDLVTARDYAGVARDWGYDPTQMLPVQTGSTPDLSKAGTFIWAPTSNSAMVGVVRVSPHPTAGYKVEMVRYYFARGVVSYMDAMQYVNGSAPQPLAGDMLNKAMVTKDRYGISFYNFGILYALNRNATAVPPGVVPPKTPQWNGNLSALFLSPKQLVNSGLSQVPPGGPRPSPSMVLVA